MDRLDEPDLASSAFKAEPYVHWTLLRDLAPVHSVRLRNGSVAWLVSRYDDAVAVLSDPRFVRPEDFLSTVQIGITLVGIFATINLSTRRPSMSTTSKRKPPASE